MSDWGEDYWPRQPHRCPDCADGKCCSDPDCENRPIWNPPGTADLLGVPRAEE